MPSPFPGMDPYLETTDIWPDFHDALAGEIRHALNRSLPAPYYARLEMRPEVGIVEEDRIVRRIVPDVVVVRRPSAQPDSGGGVAVLDGPRTAISKFFEVEVRCDPIRHALVEIRDPSRGHRLVTLIEIVSPTNKRPGPDRDSYLHKQRQVLESDANLIELDLLRGGERLVESDELREFLGRIDPVPDYLVMVNRSWRRVDEVSAYQVFPVLVTECLPCIPVPLRPGQDEVPLDLQFALQEAYDSGPYRRGAVDYAAEPDPPLPALLTGWAEAQLRAAGLR